MTQKSIQYTKRAQKTLQFAQILTIFDKKRAITWEKLFRGVYVMIRQTSFDHLFWKLLGVEVDLLDDHFDEIYDGVEFVTKPKRFLFQKSLLTQIVEEHGKNKIDFLELLYTSLNSSSKAFLLTLKNSGFNVDTILNHCQYILRHPAISKIGIFAFLELLTKLLDKLPLDVNDVDLMNIELMQHLPIDMSEGQNQDTLDRDDNKSDVSTDKKKEGKKKLTVEYFGTDLCKEFRDGEMDPIIGREKEIDQMIYTLLRKTKNNPLLIGEAWVGKTAVVEWLAQRIVSWNVPEKLQGKKLYMLDMWSLVAWTKYRGEFEARMKSILDEAMDIANNIILFIDEIHSIIGAWGQENNDAAQMIKPLLARWKIKLVGATTFDEYQKYIEKDAALKRRFQEINIDEPDYHTTKEILVWLKKHYEDYHGVVIEDEAIENAIKLSQRYILNKHLPDKALDIIDEACARKSTLTVKLEQDDQYKLVESEVHALDEKIEASIDSQNYFKAAELKEKQESLKKQMHQMRNKKSLPLHLRVKVQVSDIGKVLSDKTWIPANLVTESEKDKLRRLKIDLQKTVLWQDEAVEAVVSSITRNRLSVIEKDKPIGSFLFLGPSGTGKTHVAKMLAKHYFGDEKAMIRVDMSEFMEKYSVSKLIGSAPWYVWHEQGWLLTEQVRRNPYSVILLDEVEKASKDVLNILLQLLDEGHLKDSKGRWIDFKSTIIVMTSNLWSDEFSKKLASIGFSPDVEWTEEFDQNDFDKKKARVMERLKKYMSPELLNRLDHVIVFRPLSKKIMKDILKSQLKDFMKAWWENTAVLPTFTDKKLRDIVDEVYDPQLGARPLEKYINQKIEPDIIEKLMSS